MGKLFKSKRAVSPLVATVLLILFSIGLGAVVMSWGEAYIEEKAEFVQGVQETVSGCESAYFDFVTIGNEPQICVRQNVIEMIVDNNPNIDLFDVHARIVGTAGVYVRESILDQPLKRASSRKIMFSFQDIGQLRQVKFTPQILMGTTVTMCPQQAILVESIGPCA
jgi:hypothetical protein